MKFLIWFGCTFILSLITVLLKYAGVLLGFIPTFVLGTVMFLSARTLCKKWDERQLNKKTITMKKQIGYKSFNKTSQIICVVMNIVAMLFLIVLFFMQDIKENFYEDVTLSIYYIVLFSIHMLLSIVMIFQKNKKHNMFQSVIAIMLLLTVVCILIDGSLFSKGYVKYITKVCDNYILKYIDYQYNDMILWGDIILLIMSFVVGATILMPYIKVLYNKLTSKYYKSLRYREKCYKKLADMKSHLEHGIITQNEFEKNKSDILKRIKTDEDKTVINRGKVT